jgi:hypothetical protein
MEKNNKNKGQNYWNRAKKYTKNQWNKKLILWKNKQAWQASGKSDKKWRGKGPKIVKSEMKKGR